MDLTYLKEHDPLHKQPEQGEAGSEMSPMDPPEALAPPAPTAVPPSEMHAFLRKFTEEHAPFAIEIKRFEEAIVEIQKNGFTRELNDRLKHFFHAFDQDFIPHSRKEEMMLFPLLHEKMLASGEHSTAEVPKTPINLMLDDHLKAIQLASVVLNFLGLVFRLPDEKSRLVALDAALEQAKNLVELLNLHIFREDNIIFGSAHRLISGEEFSKMESHAKRCISICE